MDRRVDYNSLAPTYDARYAFGTLPGVAAALERVAQRVGARDVLEVGCGTGHWLRVLGAAGRRIFGADASTGMLSQARPKSTALLAAARANHLPFDGPRFDLVFCVNAIHHFDDPRDFILRARELLKPGGALSITGIDPRARGRYFYDYFPGSYEFDLQRFPSFGAVLDWMAAAGLESVEYSVADVSAREFEGAAVLNDPFLAKNSNSLLAALSPAEYETGLANIRSAIAAYGGRARFREHLSFVTLTAFG